jgi:hypothetical protein
MRREKEGKMTIGDATHIIMDKVCLYDVHTKEDLWRGMIGNTPEQYIKLEIKIIGAKRKGVVDIGISFPSLPGNAGRK